MKRRLIYTVLFSPVIAFTVYNLTYKFERYRIKEEGHLKFAEIIDYSSCESGRRGRSRIEDVGVLLEGTFHRMIFHRRFCKDYDKGSIVEIYVHPASINQESSKVLYKESANIILIDIVLGVLLILVLFVLIFKLK